MVLDEFETIYIKKDINKVYCNIEICSSSPFNTVRFVEIKRLS